MSTAYLKLVTNPTDELAFKRLVQLLPGIGGKGADKLWKKFRCGRQKPDAATPPVEHRKHPTSNEPRWPPPSNACASVRCRKKPPWPGRNSWPLSRNWKRRMCAAMPSKMIRLVVEAGYEEHLKENYREFSYRGSKTSSNWRFSRGNFMTIEDFLTQLALLTNVEAEDDQPANRDDEQLQLSTIHQAKGLEFDVVFIIMFATGCFLPRVRSTRPESEEEERRLFYVAITRARNELYLSYPLIRAMPGGSGDTMQQPSRFLKEIPKELIEEWNLRSYG